LIDVVLEIMARKLKHLSVFTPERNLSCSEAGRRRLLSLGRLDKFGRKKITVRTGITELMTDFLAK